MPVLPTMQSDDVRQENMATVNTALILLQNASKESNLSTQELQNVTYIGHYISTLYITYIRHYISALFNLGFMFIHCHKR